MGNEVSFTSRPPVCILQNVKYPGSCSVISANKTVVSGGTGEAQGLSFFGFLTAPREIRLLLFLHIRSCVFERWDEAMSRQC